MIKKIIRRLFLFLIAFTAAVFLLLSISFSLMQTKTAQERLANWIILEAQKNGFSLDITGLQGSVPLKWSCETAFFQWGENKTLSLKKVQFRIGLLPLFKGQLSLSFLKVEQAHLTLASWKQGAKPFTEVNLISLPFHLSAKTVKINDLILTDFSSDRSLHLQISGKAQIQRSFQEMQANLLVSEPLQKNSLSLQLLSSKKREIINAKATVLLKDSKNLSAFFTIPLEAAGETNIRCWGKWQFWQNLKNRLEGDPLCFAIEAAVENLQTQVAPFLDRKWDLQTEFSLWPDLSSACENCVLASDWLKFLGRIAMSSSFVPLSGSAVIKISDIAPMQDFFPFTLQGAIEAKVGLRDTLFLASAFSPHLLIGKELCSPANFKIDAEKIKNQWQGKAFCDLQNQELPWIGSSEFSLQDTSVHLADISLQAGNAKISGSGFFHFKEPCAQGSFFVLIPELRPFRLLFPQSDLEGKLGGSLSLSYQNKDLDMSAHLLVKNARYQSSLVDTVQIDLQGKNLLSTPSGLFQFDAENLLTRGGHLAKLQLSSQSQEDGCQAFSLEAFGNWKKDFSLASSGIWAKNPKSWSVQCQQLEGLLFNLPFSSSSFSFGKQDQTLFLDQGNLQIGEGTFSLNYTFGDNQAQINTKAKHLPLSVFSLFYPNIFVQGFASFQGCFEGSPKIAQGYLIATLEEAELSQIQAKGSLQLHLNSSYAQLQAHLYAPQNQFLDCTMSIPTEYSYDPFRIKIHPTKPLAGELTAQGAIEELLSFIQTASQKTSGWVTCHQLLSGSLQSPGLQGSLSLQDGYYESYFSGTKLKNISFQAQSTGSSLLLTEFQASDLKDGAVDATGSLLLNRSELFPFSIEANLHNLHLIQTDMLDAAATGLLTITGNTEQAKASGNLIMEKTVFSISDSLPSEIPSLPIEYINKPVHLQRSEIILPQEYPFKLDLSLLADNTVIVKGKGLDSHWKGNVQVTGTPSNLTGKGSLILEKGEFKFSGKTFTLMQGDLSFYDRPDQKAYLKIIGQLQIPSAMIIATMQGPLTSPKLTFHSNPPMPTSSILSLILFNKDISEISPLQAIQIAQVIMSLSGSGGPDVLEAIRKSLGVDRLNIVGKDGSDEISVQIGWYLTHGITVSLSQSASSSDITVDVDLKHGFIFEAETQNQEEGKFSLKWNCNY